VSEQQPGTRDDRERDAREAARELRGEVRSEALELREQARVVRAEHIERVRAEREEYASRMRAERESHAARLREVREATQAARAGRRRTAPDGEAAPDTRERIQQVALELFTENGYEATSLREIAEHLGVTKAALYYHFKTKEEIVDSIIGDLQRGFDELIEWARDRPRDLEMRRELIRRYSAVLYERDHQSLIKFYERNQTAMAAHSSGQTLRGRMAQILNSLSLPGEPLTTRIRHSVALLALHASLFAVPDSDVTDEERRLASLEVALELVERD
jgi:AcrR family transcriptional regulator